ncbi:DMSO/TMAO reductase YedYZ molybdopterin-dependent catalytic subunit [Advenella incenata]|jgi:DMSO/TMAO reductase YedYZ molybdopterin-dependent catalytic subunit|uniref:DMSO/TMAO reductase YedYZ molybdopterin-dependent catalytic subunit n=1 Tax=Advenella incenata TaxID=267800 RepID=A0A4Q7VAJ5_9BURK|nr:molybdopterin-binding protein [Advenella incenata]RZT91708.1 DMSO/TMAO reductase YedYZ molybdopterin-dependent catalytic subunit [Advenella incenata]
MMQRFSRRRILTGLLSGVGVSMLAGCDRLTQSAGFGHVLRQTEKLTMGSQRLLLDRKTLAQEYSTSDLSPVFRANGTQLPDSEEYARLLEQGFVDWRLQVDGLVNRPLSLSLDQLKRLPARTQITRHDCVEGWSAIGQWQGVPLGRILDLAQLKPGARYVVFHCADELEVTFDGSGRYYESIDLMDAYHPQTILAYGMNGKPLPVAHGAPLRLRVERQLGYKHAKYLMRIEVVSAFDTLWGGRGGYWEDRGYEWYAGI